MPELNHASSNWWVYLIRTRHQSLYCGITTDIERRFAQHQTGKGAKALRGKGPLQLVWSQSLGGSKSHALKIELAIKKLSKRQKEQLVITQESYHLPMNLPSSEQK